MNSISRVMGGLILIALAVVCMTCVLSVPGCKTTPTASQAVVIDSAVAAAVSIAIQNGTADPAVWAARASTITDIVIQIRPDASTGTVSIPALSAEVSKLLSKFTLTSSEQTAAAALVASLAAVLNANVQPGSPQQATVLEVLDDVTKAAAVYLPMKTAPPAA